MAAIVENIRKSETRNRTNGRLRTEKKHGLFRKQTTLITKNEKKFKQKKERTFQLDKRMQHASNEQENEIFPTKVIIGFAVNRRYDKCNFRNYINLCFRILCPENRMHMVIRV